MTLVRIRNNSERLITLPAVGNASETVKGPQDSIRLPPGTVTPVESSRLELYASPAFEGKFEEGKHGERAILEVLRPEVPTRGLDELLRQYDSNPANKTASEPEVKASGNVARTNSRGEVINAPVLGGSNTLPNAPVTGSALDVAG